MDAFVNIFDLPVSRVTAMTSFVALSGNSLLAIKLVSQLCQQQLSISSKTILEIDTVASIAGALLNFDPEPYAVPMRANDDSRTAPFTPSQDALLRGTMVDPYNNYVFYSTTRTLGLDDDLDAKKLKHAWQTIFECHDIYRTTFDLGSKTQVLVDNMKLVWDTIILSTVEAMEERSKGLRQAMREKLSSQSGVNAIEAPHFWILEVPGQQIRMNWALHHVYMDAWSFGILLSELRYILEGRENELQTPHDFFDLSRLIETQLERQDRPK